MKFKSSNTILYFKKWNETVKFYREILELEVGFSNEWFIEFYLNGSARLGVANETRTSIKSSQGAGITIGFQVDDIQMMYTHLNERSLQTTSLKVLWEAEVFYVHDPEGTRIEFWSPVHELF